MILDFFNLKPDAFGLDISGLSIKIARLKPHRGTFALSSYGEVQVSPGIIKEGEILKPGELRNAVKNAVQSVKGEKLDTQYAVVSLPEEKAFLQVVQLPRMELNQISQAVSFEAENYIPYSLDTVYLDSQVIRPLKDHLDHIDVLLASLPRTTIDVYLSVVRAAGLVPLAFEIESLAVIRSLIPNEVSATPQLIIDLGATRTSFIIFAGTSLRFTASIPISSANLTEHIAKALKLPLDRAEYTKRHYGLAGVNDTEGREVFDVLVPPLTDLVEQIKKHMSYYESHSGHLHLPARQSAITKILLCGGGANLPGLPEFLQKELGIKVELGNPWVNILPSPLQEVPGLPFKDSIRFTSALGLAMRGIRKT